MDDFFAHENGIMIMTSSSKTDLMDCLESMYPALESEPTVDVIDGAAILHTLDPKKSNKIALGNTFAFIWSRFSFPV